MLHIVLLPVNFNTDLMQSTSATDESNVDNNRCKAYQNEEPVREISFKNSDLGNGLGLSLIWYVDC